MEKEEEMGAGDFHKDDFSDEERAALGEVEEDKGKVAPPEKAEPEADTTVKTADPAEVKTEEKTEPEVKTEPTEKEQAAMSAEGAKLIEENGYQYILDKDGEKIPVARFKRVMSEKKVTENKLNLFKNLGADEYYKVYPDEKPEGYQAKREPTPAAAEEDFNSMVITGGKYDGQTIGEVAQIDPVSANLMVNNYLEGKKAAVVKEAQERDEFQRNFNTEKNTFCLARAKELFNKEKDFTPDEIQQINTVYQELANFMVGNKIAHYRMDDAYFIMNKDKIVKTAKIDAAKAAINEATKKPVGSIGSGDSNAGVSGFEAYLAMTEDALAKSIDKMSDKDQMKFYKDAPKSLRDKYPSLPW
jgi:hypothetical protein